MRTRQLNDSDLAQRLLKIRDRGGYRLSGYLRMNFGKYAFILLYFSAALLFFAVTGLWFGFTLVLGMLLGTLLRDLGWVRAVGQNWPFTVKVTDWGRVEALAGEVPAA
jgi:hypothetical protein